MNEGSKSQKMRRRRSLNNLLEKLIRHERSIYQAPNTEEPPLLVLK